MIDTLVTRWLRSRNAALDHAPAGTRVTLAHDDSLRETLGETFLLASLAPTAPVPPGVEPLFPGSRITDLLAADLADVRGIAVTTAATAGEELRFVFSYQAVFSADRRSEGLIRVALSADGSPTTLPPDTTSPLVSAGDADAWRQRVALLLPAANQRASLLAASEIARIEREAQVRLYRTVRRLATVYQQRRVDAESDDEMKAEFRRMVEAEGDRHRLTVTLTLIGVTVVT